MSEIGGRAEVHSAVAAMVSAILAGAMVFLAVTIFSRLRGSARLRQILGKYERGVNPARPRLHAPMGNARIGQAPAALRNALPKTPRVIKALDEQLATAGLLVPAKTWMTVSAAAALILGLLCGWVLRSWVASLVLAVLAFVAANFGYLPGQIRRRKDRFTTQLPLALQNIAGSLRAGTTLLAAVDGVAQLQNDEVSFQFQRALAEVQFGADLIEALARVAARMDSQDLRWLVLALEIHREVGGPLNELVDGVAQSITDRAELHRERRVVSAEGRLSSRVLMAVPLIAVLAIYLIRPGYLQFFIVNQTGWIFLLMFAVLMLGGWFWMRRILSEE